MADVHTPEIRSYNMSCIHASNTRPEEKVRKYLFARGFRFRKNDKRYPGKPDIVLPKYKTCIFINGCFWHMHRKRKIKNNLSIQENSPSMCARRVLMFMLRLLRQESPFQ